MLRAKVLALPVAAKPLAAVALAFNSDCCAAGHQTSKIKRELLAYLTQEWDYKVQKLLFRSLPGTLIKLLP